MASKAWVGVSVDRRGISGAVAVVAFLVAAALVGQAIRNVRLQAESLDSNPSLVETAVAAVNVAVGTPIDAGSVVLRAVPRELAADVALVRPADLVGRVPSEPLLAGEVIRSERLADARAGLGWNALIPKGARALSIDIHDGAALSGYLDPGDRVDVLVTISREDHLETETLVLLQAIEVLAVNDRATGEDTARARPGGASLQPSVTLRVTPEQAEQVAHAERRGSIRLALRNIMDEEGVSLGSVGSDDLLPFASVVPVAKPVMRAKSTKSAVPEETLVIIRANNKVQRRVVGGEVQK